MCARERTRSGTTSTPEASRSAPPCGSTRPGRVNAIFTLGSPAGWRTAQGLLIGQGVSDAQRLYGSNLTWSACIGYGAMSMRTGNAITSIYTSGESIYGFAITSPGTPVCQ
jgi:hypothetical protein